MYFQLLSKLNVLVIILVQRAITWLNKVQRPSVQSLALLVFPFGLQPLGQPETFQSLVGTDASLLWFSTNGSWHLFLLL